MSEPRRIGEVLDAEAWAGIEQERQSAAVTDQTKAAVRMAIRTLRTANLAPTFGFDDEDAGAIWSAKLAQYQSGCIIRAAEEYISQPGREFPTLHDFETMVAAIHRRLQHPEQPKREPGQVCIECGDTDEDRTQGWVYLTDPTQGGTQTLRPCSICKPEQFDLYERGHKTRWVIGEGPCRCGSQWCSDTKRRQERTKARGSR